MAFADYSELVARYGFEDVAVHNTLMNGITSSRGESMGFEQVDILTLREDGTFELSKGLKSTIATDELPDPVSVHFTFHGTYTIEGGTVTLSKAVHAEGDMIWGTISNYMDVTEGHFESESSPGILSFYPTGFFVDRAQNTEMTVYIDPENGSFNFQDFIPELLDGASAGAIVSASREKQTDKNAGLMPEPLAEDMSQYILKDTFAQNDMLIGTCINLRAIQSPYAEIVKEQFSSVTLENSLKPQYTLNQQKSKETGKLTVEFSDETVQLLDWCAENNMLLRGHTLIWYQGTPDWIFREGFEDDGAYVEREEMLVRMENYIRGWFEALENGAWSDIMYCVDVVNEAVVVPGSMRELAWKDIIGDDYVWHAFKFAKQSAPVNIRLAYNDFDLDTKADKVIELVNTLVDENGGKLIDVVGHQGHYGACSNINSLAATMERISNETGCEVQITELDVNVSRNGTADELKLQGQFYYNFCQELFNLKKKGVNVSGLTLWGFADSVSWMPNNYMHLYDKNMVAKYSYFGVLGIHELAGFDCDGASTETGGYEYVFVVAGDDSRYVKLTEDGAFTDTVAGAEIIGTYFFDGVKTFSLNPDIGGYISLVISNGGMAAIRTEAAGAVTELVKEAFQRHEILY